MCEFLIKFYLEQNEDYSLGDSISDCSEKLLQRVREEGKYVCDFSEERVHKNQTFFSNFFFEEGFC